MPRTQRSSAGCVGSAVAWLLRAFLGPWTIRPVLLAVLYAIVNQYAAVRVAEVQQAPLSTAMLQALPTTAAVCAGLLLSAWLGRTIQLRKDPSVHRRGVYLLSLLLVDACFSLIRALILTPPWEQVLQIAVRDFVALLIVSATFGLITDRLVRQIRRTQDALDLVEVQREQLLVADERGRQEIARHLHDNVQADLIVLAMQLRRQATTLPTPDAERIISVVDELDRVRLRDIRAAGRRLNPDIEALGLPAALKDLAAGYAPAMTATIECPLTLPGATPDHQLAIYRIAEQALLNAAIHGRAREATIGVSQADVDVISVRVGNDGRPMTTGPNPGTGSAIIAAWVSRFEGSWALTQEGGQTVLTAHLHLTPRPHNPLHP